MKLNSSQIEHLFAFTRQHYVEYYDLQIELVDHLANAIEAEWEQNPKLSFEQVLDNEFKKFGVFGFMGVVEEKQKFLDKKYRKIIWSYYKNFFRLPKIIITLFLIYSLYHFVQLFHDSKATLMGLAFISMIFMGISLYITNNQLNNTRKKTGKKWLLENVAFDSKQAIFAFLPTNLVNIFSVFDMENLGHWANWHLLLFCVFYTLFALYLYIHQTVMPKRIAEEIAKNYPDYEFVK